MSGDPFDRDVRDLLLQNARDGVPDELRARVAAVPMRGARPSAWRFLRSRTAIAAATACLVVALAGGVLVGSGPHPAASPGLPAPTTPSSASSPPSTTPASPSPSPTPSPAHPAPSPLTSADVDGLPVMDLPAEAIRVTPVPESLAAQAGRPPTGPYAYLPNPGGPRPFIWVVDTGGGSVRRLTVSTVVDDFTGGIAVGGGWLAVVVTRRIGVPASDAPTCEDERAPIAWRILVAPLGADGMPSAPLRELDSGLATHEYASPGTEGMNCIVHWPPQVAIAAGRVAYAVEAPRPAAPNGWRLLVRSLADGSLLRSIDTPEQVSAGPEVSGTSVAWSEEVNRLTDGDTPGWWAREAAIDGGPAHEIPVGVPPGPEALWPPFPTLDGSVVYASWWAQGGNTVVRVDGSHRTVVTAAPVDCWVSAADGGVVVLSCTSYVPDGGPANPDGSRSVMELYWLASWSQATGLRALGAGDAFVTGVVDRHDGWAFADGTDATGQPAIVAIRIAALGP